MHGVYCMENTRVRGQLSCLESQFIDDKKKQIPLILSSVQWQNSASSIDLLYFSYIDGFKNIVYSKYELAEKNRNVTVCDTLSCSVLFLIYRVLNFHFCMLCKWPYETNAVHETIKVFDLTMFWWIQNIKILSSGKRVARISLVRKYLYTLYVSTCQYRIYLYILCNFTLQYSENMHGRMRSKNILNSKPNESYWLYKMLWK